MQFSNANAARLASVMAAALLILILTVACGPSDDDDSGSVGEVGLPPNRSGVAAVVQTAKLGGAVAADGKEIFRHDEIVTGDPGSIYFTLTNPDMYCDTRQNSHLTIWPDDNTMILWSATSPTPTGSSKGKSFCAKDSSSTAAPAFGVPPRLTFTLNDPIFGVDVSEDGVILKMVHGSATATVDGENVFKLRAGRQLFVPTDGRPAQDQPLQLSDEDHEMVNGLQAVSPLPDLQVNWDESIYQQAAESCDISYTVRNAGETVAGESVAHVDYDGLALDDVVPALEAGGSQSLTATILGSMCEGTGTLEADFLDTVAESDEEDNAVPIGLPNLQVTFEDYAGQPDGTCEISFSLINSGQADAGESVTHLDLNGETLDEPGPGLPTGESTQLTALLPGTCEGNGELRADAENQVPESNEDDNTALMTFLF